ncbi:MAG: ISKra4 family transposase [Candidatus Paceibacterota bacterium]
MFPSAENVSAEQAAKNLLQLAECIKVTAETCARQGECFDQAERAVRDSVLQMGYQAMQLFVALQGDGDLGSEVQTESEKTWRRSEETSSSVIRSIFGEHTFNQYTYSAGKNKPIALRPISARMSLPTHRWSHLLQEFSQMFCVDQAFGQAATNLGEVLGSRFSVDTIETINQQLGKAANEFLDDLPEPDPGSEAKLLVASADGKGVPLIKRDAAKLAAFETAKKKPGNRKIATVASVYTVDPHVRTAEDVAAALFRDETDSKPDEKNKRPRPQNKNTTAHFLMTEDDGTGNSVLISGIHVAMAWMIGQTTQRRRAGQVLVVLMDGQESLWNTFELHLSFSQRTVGVLDILHALAYVWEAAALFCSTEDERKAFTRVRLLRILRGEVLGVVRGLRQMGTTRGLKGQPRKELNRICGYLEKNASRMRYDEYLRRGYPIASGVIEGACRHLVKDRMERSGMRWTLEGARNMLNVRAAFQSDHWRSFLDDHITQETKKTHPHRNLLAEYIPLTLAC